MYKHKIVNTDTNEEIVVDLSTAEVAIIEAELEKVQNELAELEKAKKAKSAALAKLAALGLEPDDLEALGL